MNRKERRQISKRLGILKHHQTLPINDKLKIMRENIIAGKQRHNEMKEDIRVQTNAQLDEKESQKTFNIEDILPPKPISLDDLAPKPISLDNLIKESKELLGK